MKFRLLALGLVAAGALTSTGLAHDTTLYGYNARWRAAYYPWHNNYYNTQTGRPVALIVPPTAELQTDYGWGVCGTRVTRIDHQYQRPYPGYGYAGSPTLYPTPRWPSDTRQFGYYYIRGPW
jgi:hypothetical protein